MIFKIIILNSLSNSLQIASPLFFFKKRNSSWQLCSRIYNPSKYLLENWFILGPSYRNKFKAHSCKLICSQLKHKPNFWFEFSPRERFTLSEHKGWFLFTVENKESPLAYSGFVLCPFHTMEYIPFKSFWISHLFSVKGAHSVFWWDLLGRRIDSKCIFAQICIFLHKESG